MKRTLILILLAVFSISASAQETCDLGLNSAPGLYNIRLGMNGTEAKLAVGGKLKIKNKAEGVFFKNFIKKDPPTNLRGIRAIYIRFFDSRIYQVEVFYEKQDPEITIEEFFVQFSESENLPLGAWALKGGVAKLKCSEFSIIADNYLNPRLQVTDDRLLKEFEDSQKRKKEESQELTSLLTAN